MSEITYNNISDSALIETLGGFIKHHRLLQNKSQNQLAEEAGIVRSTLSLFERGENTSLIVFIQLLRALKLTQTLQEFQVKEESDSVVQNVITEHSTRRRARRNQYAQSKPKSDWYFY